MKDYYGKKIGCLMILKQGPNHCEESGFKRIQWWVYCEKCDDESLVMSRHLNSNRFDWNNGCSLCKKAKRRKPKNFYYERNINGFKTVRIYK